MKLSELLDLIYYKSSIKIISDIENKILAKGKICEIPNYLDNRNVHLIKEGWREIEIIVED